MQLGRRITTALVGALLWAIPIGAQAQTGSVAGTVVDAVTTSPIAGAAVSIGERGALTDNEGRFLIANVPAGTYQLDVLSLGYAALTRSVTVVAGETTTLDLRVSPQAVEIDNLVVIGYGVQEADELTGVIEEVTPSEFNTGRVYSPEQLIQGKVAGVNIIDSGEPGGDVQIRFRGGTSVNASNDPLFVIDGMPIAVGGGINAGRNPLNFINPQDIANITVLKDASATAIFGSRGANGVIIVETYSGAGARATGGSQLSYNGSVSAATITGQPEMLSTRQFLRAVDDYNPDALEFLGEADTDWQDAVTRDGMGHDHNIALAGAFESFAYRLSVGFLNQEGVIQNSETERATIALNFAQNFFDDALRITTNVKGARTEDDFSPGVIGSAAIYAPTQPIRQEGCFGGYFEWTSRDPDDAPCTPLSLVPSNPVGELAGHNDTGIVYRSLGDVEAEVDVPWLTGLTGTLRLGYDVSKTDRQQFRPTTMFSESRNGNLAGYVRQENFSASNVLLDAFLTYARRFDDWGSDIDVTGGYVYEAGSEQYPFFEAQGLDVDFLGTDGVPTAEQVRPGDWVDENRLISFFGRTNINVLDRYLLTLSVRRDGSSRFGVNEQWGTFPSAAFAWRVSNESFMDGVDLFSDLKLRASYGVNGNQAIPNYLGFARYRPGESTAQVQFGNDFVSTIRPAAYDPGIKWEETTSWNVGVDYAVLNNRLSGSFDFYHKETNDLLFESPVAAGTNLSNYVWTNVGVVQNRGFEMTLDALVLDGSDGGFWWNAGFNASTNSNELLQIYGGADDDVTLPTNGIGGGVGNYVQILRAGLPVHTFYLYEHRMRDGLPVWEDTNGDGSITDIDIYVDQDGSGSINEADRVAQDDAQPEWIIGHTSTMGYGAFDAGFTVRAHLGNYVYNNVASNFGHYNALLYNAGVPNNLHVSVLETGFEREQYFSSYYIEDASFLRMENLTLGYTLTPFSTGQRMRVFGTIQNVFTLTEYRGVDPMAGEFGIDNNLYPRSRTFVLGANVQF